MTSFHVDVPGASNSLASTGEAIFRVGITSLHLQARARLHEQQSMPALADLQGAIARPAVDTGNNLVAMSRYCLQHLVPRTQGLMTQMETVAEAICRLADGDAPYLCKGLESVAFELDRCGIILRGHARSSLRVAGMLRLSEQRLWGALAADLHRREGTDGPIMQGCARIEAITFDLAAAVDELLEGPQETPLAQRHKLAIALICIMARAGSRTLEPADVAVLLAGPCDRIGEAVTLADSLLAEHLGMCDTAPDVALALSIATEASAQSQVVSRLEDIFRDIDRRLTELATDYRKLARAAGRPNGRQAAMDRVATDARHWRSVADRLAEPMALSTARLDVSLPPSIPPRRATGTGPEIRA